jgi:hypothetical protein
VDPGVHYRKSGSPTWCCLAGKFWRVTIGVKLEPYLLYNFAILLFRKFQDLGSGPRFMVVDPGVHYQGPLPSPILTVQVLHATLFQNLVRPLISFKYDLIQFQKFKQNESILKRKGQTD